MAQLQKMIKSTKRVGLAKPAKMVKAVTAYPYYHPSSHCCEIIYPSKASSMVQMSDLYLLGPKAQALTP
jgi:hypothetical protein